MLKLNILGIDMDCLSYEDMHRIFNNWLSDKESRSHSVALVNVNCCVSALLDRRLLRLYNSADIIGIDGMPFLKWARAFYDKICDRFYAPDLMLEVSSKAKECGYTFFLYGGAEGAPDKIEQHLIERVEPDYPESARQQHLQGTVILSIYVGKNGTVRSLSCVTGNSELCLLAAKAVRQWKFSPLIHDGAPASFESQISMDFVLP